MNMALRTFLLILLPFLVASFILSMYTSGDPRPTGSVLETALPVLSGVVLLATIIALVITVYRSVYR